MVPNKKADILKLKLCGLSNQEVAKKLGSSRKTGNKYVNDPGKDRKVGSGRRVSLIVSDILKATIRIAISQIGENTTGDKGLGPSKRKLAYSSIHGHTGYDIHAVLPHSLLSVPMYMHMYSYSLVESIHMAGSIKQNGQLLTLANNNNLVGSDCRKTIHVTGTAVL